MPKLYKATVSFSSYDFGMSAGKVGEVPDHLVDDFLQAGFIVPFEATNEPAAEEEKPKRKGKK